MSVIWPEGQESGEHGGVFHEQPAPGFPSPYLMTFLWFCWLSSDCQLQHLLGECGPASLGDDLCGLEKEARDQGGQSEGGWAQFKDLEFLLGFEDLHGDESQDPHVASQNKHVQA